MSAQARARNGYADVGRLSTSDVLRTKVILVDARLRLRDEFDWVAFIDDDEFLDPQAVRVNHRFTRSVEDWIDTGMVALANGHPLHRNRRIFDSLAVPADGNVGLIKTRALVEDGPI